MKIHISLLFILFVISSYSQQNLNSFDTAIYSVAGLEEMPEFPGGNKEFAKYIQTNFKLPDVKGLKGKVFIEFIVEKDGTISDIKILRDIGFGTGNEAGRIIRASPIWKPGKLNGKFIRTRFALPINIEVK
jgi:protein TonB